MNEKLEKIKKLGQKSIWKSLLLNLIFLLVFLIIFNPDYEVRDDNMMKEIAAGARGTYNSYLVFINISLEKYLRHCIQSFRVWNGILSYRQELSFLHL